MATNKVAAVKWLAVKVALEALREELTTAEPAKKYSVYLMMISDWKKTALKNMAQAFGAKVEEGPPISSNESPRANPHKSRNSPM